MKNSGTPKYYILSVSLLPLLFLCGTAFAQKVCTGTIRLSTQEEVRELGTRGCNTIEGDLVVNSRGSISDLSPLSGLKNVTGTLYIERADSLRSLKGLEKIEQIGRDLVVSRVPLVTSLEGLEQLKSVGEDLRIAAENVRDLSGLGSLESVGMTFFARYISSLKGMDKLDSIGNSLVLIGTELTSLEGLEFIDSLKYLYLGSNKKLTSLKGLGNLKHVLQLRVEENPELTSLKELANVRTVGYLTVKKNNKLIDLSGLEGLTQLKYLELERNAQLTTLKGLENAKVTEKIQIEGNPDLQSIAALHETDSVQRDVLLHNNAKLNSLHGLENLQKARLVSIVQNDGLTSLTGLNGLRKIEDRLLIERNDNLTTLDGIENLEEVSQNMTIAYNNNLMTLSGLENLSTVYRYEVKYNHRLEDCCALPFLPRIGNINIYGNAPGRNCENREVFLQHCVPQPKIHRFSPESGGPGTAVTINGLGFALTRTLSFGEIPARFEIESDSVLHTWSPAELREPNSIVLTNVYKRDSSLLPFTPLEAPVEPQRPATEFELASKAGGDDVDLQWKNGDGHRRLVVMKALDNPHDFIPKDDTVYTTDLGLAVQDPLTGNYLVYGGADNNIHVQGLEWDTEYKVFVYEYNTDGKDKADYLLTNAPSLVFRTNVAVCERNTFTLSSQALVDKFKCSEFVGNLTISGNDITDLSPLTDLKSVTGTLHIRYNPRLESLLGLSELSSVGSLSVVQNSSLRSFDGLGTITASVYDVRISGNGALLNIGALSIKPQSPIFSVSITDNPMLRSLTGMEWLRHTVFGVSIYENHSLTSLEGLNNLSAVGLDPEYSDPLNIQNNASLRSLKGLDSLGFAQMLLIKDNPVLSSLEGLEHLRRTELSMEITNNPNLTDLHGLESLESVGIALVVSDNHGLTSLRGLDNLKSLGAYYFLDGTSKITNNNSLKSLQGLESLSNIDNLTISNNPALTSLTGLSGLKIAGPRTQHGFIRPFEISNNISLESLRGLDSLSYANNLNISGNPVLTSLEGLGGLKAVGPQSMYEHSYPFVIHNNASLRNLSGLENLTQISNLTISDNTALTSLEGLNSLKTIGPRFMFEYSRPFEIRNNPSLSSVKGLDSLIIIDNLTLSGNPALTSLKGLDRLQSITTDLWVMDNDSLNDLAGLERLDSIGNQLIIEDNDFIRSLKGLESLETIGGDLKIDGNTRLNSLARLNSLEVVSGKVEVTNNPHLNKCCILDRFRWEELLLSNNNESCSFVDNYLSYCDSPPLRIDEVIHDNMLTVKGSGFETVTKVKFKGRSAEFEVLNDSLLITTLPRGLRAPFYLQLVSTTDQQFFPLFFDDEIGNRSGFYKDNSTAFSILISENPLTDRTQVSVLSNQKNQIAEDLYVTDLSGSMVRHLSLKNKTIVLNKTDFTPGFYLLRATVHGRPVAVERLVVE